MFDKMKELMALQLKLSSLKKELSNATLELEWFESKLKIKINAKQEILSLDIDNTLIAPDFNLKLLTCLNEAIRKSHELAAQKTRQITGIKIPGL